MGRLGTSSDAAAMNTEPVPHQSPDDAYSLDHEKNFEEKQHLEDADADLGNLVYDRDEVEPQLHMRTFLALAAMFVLNYVGIMALQGPPSVLSFIAADLHNTASEVWVVNALSLVQAVISPILSSASDTFQARKALLVGPCILSFIGSAIAPGSKSIYRLIGAQILLGFGLSTVPLAFCVPSEILPRKWRPMAQAFINVAAALAACTGPLIIGALTKANPHTGWRNYYWIQMGLWGFTALALFFGYRPPPRHTRLDHLSFFQKIGRLDLPGFSLLTAGLTLFLTALNLGGGISPWGSAKVLSTLIIGLVLMFAFGVYEWKFTSTGLLHHDLFRGGRTFPVCIGLIAVEGILFFSYVIYYPVLTVALFETDPFLEVARAQAFWIAAGLSTILYGTISTKFKIIRGPLIAGFLLLTAGIAAFATLQPIDNTPVIVYAGIAGLGFGSPLILIIAAVQLSTPYHLIATATAVTTSSRAIAGTIFTAIYSVAVNHRLNSYIPTYVGKAALGAGLPPTSLGLFVKAVAGNDAAALPKIPGVTPAIIGAGLVALKQAFADGIRVVYIIAAPFGALAFIGCFFLGDLKKTMNYHVDAPVEELQAKRGQEVVHA